LTVESLQDTYYSKGNSWDASLSVGIGTDDMGKVFGNGEGKSNAGNNSIGAGFSVGNDYTDIAWVNDQTSLTGNNVNINVGNKTDIAGAIIASVEYDEAGNITDNGNLKLTTKELEYSDIVDINVSKANGFGLSTMIGATTNEGETNLHPQGQTTLSIKKTGSESEQINRATVGKGVVEVDGEEKTNEQLTGLNRDVNKSQELTKEMITGALDGSVTIDNRVFTEEGRKSIVKDFKEAGKNLEQIYENITENNIIVQSVKAVLNDDNDLSLIGAIKQYIGLVDSTKKSLDDTEKDKDGLTSEQKINGATNLTPEQEKEFLRNTAENYKEEGKDLGKVEFSIADGIGIKGITTVNLSNLDITNPNEIAGYFAGIGASNEKNAGSRSDMASAIMDMMNYGNVNTNKITTQEWLNKTGSDGISYANSLFDKTWDTLTNEKISKLDPRVQNPAADFINDVKDKLDINLRVTDGYRSTEKQDSIFSQNNGVTNATGGKSYHNYGLAIDVVAIMQSGKTNYNVVPANESIVDMAESYGFQWGGYWKSPYDPPHFQMRLGKDWPDKLENWRYYKNSNILKQEIQNKNNND
jgi:filamentous hemagglutinin